MVEKLIKNLIPIAIIIAGILIAGAIVYINQGKSGILSPQAAAEKAIDYINQNLLQKGVTASLVNVKEENGIYKFRLKIENQEFDSYVTKDGKILFFEGIDLAEEPRQPEERAEEKSTTLGNFSVSGDKVCQEDGKPIIYFFGSQSCPHCTWEHPIIEEVAEQFGDYISFHNNMDSNTDIDVFSRYSTGGIPTLVLGCKYYRVGSGERAGKEEEAKVLTTLICDLTDNQPNAVCQEK
jgi:thiol-disulfide isomerase/thioredoxin